MKGLSSGLALFLVASSLLIPKGTSMIIRKPVREKPSMLVAVYQTALLRGTVEAEIKVGLYAGNQEAPKILPVRTLVLWIFDIGLRSDQNTSKVIKKKKN